MKDQIRLLRECVRNEIPAIVFQGDDSCTVEVLEAAHAIYAKHGASCVSYLHSLQYRFRLYGYSYDREYIERWLEVDCNKVGR